MPFHFHWLHLSFPSPPMSHYWYSLDKYYYGGGACIFVFLHAFQCHRRTHLGSVIFSIPLAPSFFSLATTAKDEVYEMTCENFICLFSVDIICSIIAGCLIM
jgi:hypothetical protein